MFSGNKSSIMSPINAKANRLMYALFFHSLSIISFQIILMRILSIMQWDYFANMIIGIAMLGFGVSGTLLALTKQRLIRHADKLIPLLMVCGSILMLVAYRMSQHEALKFDTFLVFSSGKELYKLIFFIWLYFMPFFTASLSIGIIYVKYVDNISKLYFANLIGSGIGGILGPLTLFLFLPHKALIAASVFPVLATLFLMSTTNKKMLLILLLLFFSLFTWHIVKPLPPSLSQYKALSRTLQLPDAQISTTVSGISSLVEIVESDYLRYAPGLSLNYIGQVPVKPMAFVNGNAAGFIPKEAIEGEGDILDYTVFRLPYVLSNYKTACIIQSGTGSHVAQALRKGLDKVYAIEPEINLINALDKWHTQDRPYVYAHPKVDLQKIEARSFFNTTDARFDLIILPNMGSFGSGLGLQAIREEFSLTQEALNSYWQKLNKTGVLAITVYTDFPPRAVLKTTAGLVQMLKNNGINEPLHHIAAVRSWTAISFTVTKQALSKQQIENVKSFCHEMSFDPFILADVKESERYFYNYIDDKSLFVLSDTILKNPISSVISDYLFYIHPASDDKPYFSRFLKISSLKELLNEYPLKELPFLELGYIIVWLTLLIALVFSILLILLPVFWQRKNEGRTPVFLYFGAIGLGFMFFEIILIQRFILYLGQPVYAVSSVLSIMLLASGFGSYFSSKLDIQKKKFHVVYIIVFAVILLYAFFLTDFLRFTAGNVLWVRIIFTVFITGIPAFFMGMPFPLGMRLMNIQKNNNIAWGWGINGFFSVIATPLALIIAIETGATNVMLIAAFAYITALGGVFLMTMKK